MKAEELDALFAMRQPGQPALVRLPDHPNERFEVVAVTDGHALIGSQWHHFDGVSAEVLEPWFRPPPSPPYAVLVDVAMTTLRHAADHPDASEYHRRRLTEMCEELDGFYGAVIANRDRTTAGDRGEVTGG